uniref:Uncharacterized protein n=1 Tax=Anguilla anguilla TaxID=7936 RepID=A0A0E9PWM0_ANGAN
MAMGEVEKHCLIVRCHRLQQRQVLGNSLKFSVFLVVRKGSKAFLFFRVVNLNS